MALLSEQQIEEATPRELEEARAALARHLGKCRERAVITAGREALAEHGEHSVARVVCGVFNLGDDIFFHHVVRVEDAAGGEADVPPVTYDALEAALDNQLATLVRHGWPIGRCDELIVDLVAGTLIVRGRDDGERLMVHAANRWWVAESSTDASTKWGLQGHTGP